MRFARNYWVSLVLATRRLLGAGFVFSALVWQLMKAYTLSILAKLSGQDSNHPIVDKEIVVWANQKVACLFEMHVECKKWKLHCKNRCNDIRMYDH